MFVTSHAAVVYRFGAFRADAGRRQLFRNDQAVPLTPKAFDTLIVLLERAGEDVDKDGLLRRVWPDANVEENNLTQAISRLRKALGDTIGEHRFIVTLPGRGYRFVEPVSKLTVEPEPLAERLRKGSLPVREAVEMTLDLLSALELRHRQHAAHGALSPAAILLDGDRCVIREDGAGIEDAGRYAAPEGGGTVPADIFSAGSILFEALTGRTPWTGSGREQFARRTTTPPVLGGSAAVAAIDRVVHRALAANPRERYASVRDMADDLRDALLAGEAGDGTVARTVTRVIVLPFRVLRPDPDTDFLAFSLPDAITTSLSALESVVVRSSATAARFAGDAPDLEAIAARAGADVVLTGTLLRAGHELRINTQLVETPGGTVIWSHVFQAPLGDMFSLQDALTRQILESLPISLTARDRRLLHHDVPATARAYEFYLRANSLSYDPKHWTLARDLYLQCLAEDPQYAPAWARVGRLHRVIGLYTEEDVDEHYRRAHEAFRRALDLNPDLALAHNLYTHVEVELGGARQAMLRLIARAKGRPGDPEVYAGLVHACRYCGLLDAAVAAFRLAERLDPQVRTSVAHAYWMRGDHAQALAADKDSPPFAAIAALFAVGRCGDAAARLEALEALPLPASMHYYLVALRAIAEGRPSDALEASTRVDTTSLKDPCGRFYVSRMLSRVGDAERALTTLRAAADGGFFCYSAYARDPWLDTLRIFPEFTSILRTVEAQQRAAHTAFLQAGGDRVLGLALR